MLALFMYKTYINGLLRTLTQHSCALSISSLRLTCTVPYFSQDVYEYLLRIHGVKWRYEFKSSIVTFGEAMRVHCQSMDERDWVLGNGSIDELCEYKNPGIVKIYIGSFSFNADENIDKTRKERALCSLRILIAENLHQILETGMSPYISLPY